jgi:hypothetical protein
MSTPIPHRPVSTFLLLETPALPVGGLLLLTGTVSLVLGNVAVLGWTAIIIAGIDTLILATFLIGGRPLRPLNESNLLAQVLTPFGRFLLGALGMVASSFLGAIIAIYVAADVAGSGSPGWTSSVIGPVLAFALVLGTIGSLLLLSRRVRSLKPRDRVKSLRRGVRRLCRLLQAPVIELDVQSLALRHLATRWYLLWLPLLALLVTAVVLSVVVRQ